MGVPVFFYWVGFSVCNYSWDICESLKLRQRGRSHRGGGHQGRGQKILGGSEEDGELELPKRGSLGQVELPPAFDSIEAQILLVQASMDQLAQVCQADHIVMTNFFSDILHHQG